MATKFQRKVKLKRLVKKLQKDKKSVLIILALAIYLCVMGYTVYMDNKRLAADPNSYKPLLELIANAESNGNYNAYYGSAANSEIKFTDMSIQEVLDWQSNFVQQGSPSSAVGKYQLLNTTLGLLVQELGIDATQKFDPTTQDRLAIVLLERRGSVKYINKELSRDEFAASLAKEWAALPRVTNGDPNSSYYAGDGLNKSRVSVDEVYSAIEKIKSK